MNSGIWVLLGLVGLAATGWWQALAVGVLLALLTSGRGPRG